MKITTAKVWVVLLVATALLSVVVASSTRGRFHGSSFGHQGRGFLPPPWILEEVLELTEEQLSQIEGLQEEMRAQVKPIREEGRELRREIKAELNQEEPSPLRVGELVISGHDLRKQMREIHQSLRESFQSVLTPDQLEKLAELKNRRGGRRGFIGDREPFQENEF